MNALFDPNLPVDMMAEDLARNQADATKAINPYKAIDPMRSIYRNMRQVVGYQDMPHSIYFYYIRVNASGKLEVSHYFYAHEKADPTMPATWKPIPHDPAVLQGIITDLAKNARPIRRTVPRVRDPRKSGQRFENIQWERKSYIVFFVDEANWKFCRPPTADPVVFITQGKDGKVGNPNWSFYDALEFEIEMPNNYSAGTDKRSAIAFINHMKADDTGRDIGEDAAGNPLPPPRETQLFQFQMYMDVPFANGTSKMTVILDPDGNNMGPPIGPP